MDPPATVKVISSLSISRVPVELNDAVEATEADVAVDESVVESVVDVVAVGIPPQVPDPHPLNSENVDEEAWMSRMMMVSPPCPLAAAPTSDTEAPSECPDDIDPNCDLKQLSNTVLATLAVPSFIYSLPILTRSLAAQATEDASTVIVVSLEDMLPFKAEFESPVGAVEIRISK